MHNDCHSQTKTDQTQHNPTSTDDNSQSRSSDHSPPIYATTTRSPHNPAASISDHCQALVLDRGTQNHHKDPHRQIW